MASVKENFVYNIILTVGNYIFPLLTFPYVSRVLGVSNIGTCSYVDSIINYFILFSALGVGSLGVREIAKTKNNFEKLQEVFSTLSCFNIITTCVFACVLIIITYNIDYLSAYKTFLLLGLVKLLFSAFLIEWFFQGISDFKYVTMRSLIIRMIYVSCIFLFVRDTNDAAIYYSLSCATAVINAVVNWTHSKKFVRFNIKAVKIPLYIIPIISYGAYRILTSMYTSFNVTFLGSVTDDIQVGYYSTAVKLYTILLSVFSAFTTVMVPKVSELLNNGNHSQLERIANKTFDLVLSISIPIVICAFSLAPLII